MSRNLRAETRSRTKDEKGKFSKEFTMSQVRKWDKRWVTICETTMKIYKWVPVDTTKKKPAINNSTSDKENNRKVGGDSNSNWTTEDSNTCFSTGMSDSQPTEFVQFSEDSNSQNSDMVALPEAKRLKTAD